MNMLERNARTYVVVACGALTFGCGRSPAAEPHTAAQVMVVPADRVVERCPGEGEDEPVRGARKPVEYVRVSEWQPTPATQRLEDEMASRPSTGAAGYVHLPKLTLHQGIPETRMYGLGRSGRRY